MNLHEALDAQLRLHNLPPERFREIVGRLFAAGIVVREEDGVEQASDDLTEAFGRQVVQAQLRF